MQFQHSALHLGTSPINGQGLFSTVGVRAGEIIAIWDGFIATAAEVDLNFAEARYRNCSQVGDDQFLVPYAAGAADHVNHIPAILIAASVGPTRSWRCATSPPPRKSPMTMP